jgi:hypothetical protein
MSLSLAPGQRRAGSGAGGKSAVLRMYIKSSEPPRLHSLDLTDIIPLFAAHAGEFPLGQGAAQL